MSDRQIRFFEGHDELYWNVTGNGWDFAILEAVAEVRLPGEAAAREVTYFTGTLRLYRTGGLRGTPRRRQPDPR